MRRYKEEQMLIDLADLRATIAAWAAWQTHQREQEADRAAEEWQVTAEELESMASDYYQQEDDPLEEIR